MIRPVPNKLPYLLPLASKAEYSATDYLDASRKTIDREIKANRLPAIRVGNRIKLRVSDLDSWLDARTIGQAA